MNLVLLRAGYPLIAVRPITRPAYLATLGRQGTTALDRLLYERLDATLDEYLAAAREQVARIVIGGPQPVARIALPMRDLRPKTTQMPEFMQTASSSLSGG